MSFYITCVRSVIDYAAPVFHHALPAYLSQELERVQKRAMRIICPGIEYQQALALMSLRALSLCRVARQIDLRTVFLWPQAEL